MSLGVSEQRVHGLAFNRNDGGDATGPLRFADLLKLFLGFLHRPVHLPEAAHARGVLHLTRALGGAHPGGNLR